MGRVREKSEKRREEKRRDETRRDEKGREETRRDERRGEEKRREEEEEEEEEEERRRRRRRRRRRKKIRESVRRNKIKVWEKVGKSRNTVFFQCFGAPDAGKVGSLKRRVRSKLAR